MSGPGFEQSAIWADVRRILQNKSKPVKYEVRAMLHTVKEDIPVYKIMAIDDECDYVNRISSHIKIEFTMPYGDYVQRLYPYRDNLELTLKWIKQNETENSTDSKSKIESERYKVVFLPDQSPRVNASETLRMDKESLNKVRLATVNLELHNRSLEVLRIKRTRGIYHNETQKSVMLSTLAGESSRVLVDGKPAVDGVDIVEPDNTSPKKHILIPDDTPITELPTFLQFKMNGVYNTGIGSYFKTYRNKKLWFVYSLYDLKRFDEDVPKVIFYSVPKTRFPAVDRTYREEGDVLHIAITSDHNYQDAADQDYMNRGVGFRLTDANAVMKKPVEMTKKGPKGRRANLNIETISHSREDGLNYAPVASRAISSNPYVDYSNVNARRVARSNLVWENSNPRLLYPGMPCMYCFMDGKKVVRLKGIILFHHSLTALQGSKALNNTYRTQTALTIAIEPYSSQEKPGKFKTPGVF